MSNPTDLVYFLLNFQALQIIKLWLMALEGAVDVIVTAEHWWCSHRWLSLKINNSDFIILL